MVEPHPSVGPATSAADEMQRRLTFLERQNATLRRRITGLAVALVAGVLLGASPTVTVPDMLAAKRFALVDEAGTVRALWRMGPAGAEMAVLDAAGKPSRVVTLETATAVPATGGEAAGVERSKEGGGFLRFGKPESPPDEEEDDSFDWVE